jgi:hypothetical protein
MVNVRALKSDMGRALRRPFPYVVDLTEFKINEPREVERQKRAPSHLMSLPHVRAKVCRDKSAADAARAVTDLHRKDASRFVRLRTAHTDAVSRPPRERCQLALLMLRGGLSLFCAFSEAEEELRSSQAREPANTMARSRQMLQVRKTAESTVP